MRLYRNPLEIHLDRHALGQCDLDKCSGDRKILKSDTCAIEKGDLRGIGAARMRAIDDGTDLLDVILCDQPPATACCASPMLTDCAISSVKTAARASKAGSTSCLPFVSVPMQARCVPGLT